MVRTHKSRGSAMERLQVKIASASKALAKLREVTGIDEVPAITRNAAIQ